MGTVVARHDLGGVVGTLSGGLQMMLVADWSGLVLGVYKKRKGGTGKTKRN